MNSKNHVQLIGRLCREVNVSGEDKSMIARTTIATTRNYKDSNGEYGSDFIPIVAFGRNAEFLDKHFSKGKLIIVNGSIRTGSYTNKDGQKVYTTDVAVEDLDFVPGTSKDSNETSSEPEVKETKKTEKKATKKVVDEDDDFMNISPDEMEELPW